jgi:hypothetical protein
LLKPRTPKEYRRFKSFSHRQFKLSDGVTVAQKTLTLFV